LAAAAFALADFAITQHPNMHQHRSSHLWLSRFAIRFLQLRPEVAWQGAVSRGVAAYAHASDLDPDAVALVSSMRARVSRMIPARQRAL
jgi:hypothetical protein